MKLDITSLQAFVIRPKIPGNNIEKYLNGVKISVKYGDGIYKIYFNVEFNGIGIVSDGKLKRDIVISK